MNYNVIFSKRKSLSIIISEDNFVTVRCPKGTSKDYIEEVLRRKRAWIEKIQASNSLKYAENEDILHFKSIYVSGKKVPLYLNADKNSITDECVRAKNVKNIKKLFCGEFSEAFFKRVEEISAFTGLIPKSVDIKSYKSRWGCCTGTNQIIFNFRLFMLTEDIANYVIVHELCHTRFHNHSKSFWALVEKFIPDYKILRKKLQNYNFLTTLY